MKVTRKKWNDELIMEDALKYTHFNTYYRTNGYIAAQRRGLLKKVIAHMVKKITDRLSEQKIKLEEAGIPKNSPIWKRFVNMNVDWWRKHQINLTAEKFLSFLKITKPNGEGAEVYDYINKKWINLLDKTTHLHHCHDFNTILFFTEMQINQSMGHLGDTPLSFIELTHVLVSAGAKIPKDKLDEAKELLRKLNEAVNKMDSGLCDIVS
jgi:hypothetical protein